MFAGVASSFTRRISSSVTVAKRAAILKILSGGGYPILVFASEVNSTLRTL